MTQQMNRRDALKAFAIVSTANFLEVGSPQLERDGARETTTHRHERECALAGAPGPGRLE